MTTREGKSRTPDWMVERLAQGELDAATAADVRARLEAEGRDVAAELAAIAVSNREVLEAHPPAQVAAAVRGRAAELRAGARRPWLVGGPLALAGVAVLALVVARPGAHTTVARGGEVVLEDTTIKGPAKLHVYRHQGGQGAQGGQDELLTDGARATRGDLVQLAYRAGEGGNFGALVSIDGRGHVTLHWPEGNAELAARLSAKGEVKLPSAYELDDAPAFERFFFVTSEAPFSMASVLDAARALAARPAAARTQALALPASLTQSSLTLDKTRKETP